MACVNEGSQFYLPSTRASTNGMIMSTLVTGHWSEGSLIWKLCNRNTLVVQYTPVSS